jgi:cysteinyl-tRNA synthetase
VRELLAEGYRGAVIRVALLSHHYRSVLPFTEKSLGEARDKVDAFLGFYEYLEDEAERSRESAGRTEEEAWIAETDAAFDAALENDLDYPTALKAVVGVIDRLEPRDVGSPTRARDAMERWDEVLGILRI